MAEPAVDEFEKLEPNIEVIWKAFELRPEPLPLPPPNWEYFRQIWTTSIYPLAEKLGKKMKLPPVKPRSRLAHEAAKWAGSEGNFKLYRDTLFRAYFERGENIGEIEVLVKLASDLGLEGESLRNALVNNEFLESVLADEAYASEIKIGSVPGFVADGKKGLMGLQSIEDLRDLIESVRS